MPEISNITIFISRILFLVFITLPFSFCNGQASEKSEKKSIEKEDIAQNTQRVIFNQNTLYPQIHTNLNGMVSEFVRTMYQDKNGTMWLVTDGNGIFKYNEGEFTHLTNKNGLTDNNAADILEDRKGNIWIGTFYGGISKFDGKTYTNFTKDGIIEGIETYNFCEDSQGNIWFSAENYGVYKYDGTKFIQFTTEDGLATNGILSILEDNKGQLWFGTWQGISLYDGDKFMDASDKEPWAK